jgi:hypothetical protein
VLEGDRMPRPQNLSDSFLLVASDSDHLKAVAFNMLFMVWRRRTVSVAFRHGMELVRELIARYPRGVGVCQIVEVDAIPPDSETRAAFVECMKMEGIKHFSLTHDGVGFKAAAVRAITAGVHALARPKFKLAVFSSVAEAAHWHAIAQAELGRRETAAEIEEIVRDLRELHRNRFPA